MEPPHLAGRQIDKSHWQIPSRSTAPWTLALLVNALYCGSAKNMTGYDWVTLRAVPSPLSYTKYLYARSGHS